MMLNKVVDNHVIVRVDSKLVNTLPGLITVTSFKTGGRCGLQTATKIIRRIASPPTATPIMAAFEIGAEQKIQGKKRSWFIMYQ